MKKVDEDEPDDLTWAIGINRFVLDLFGIWPSEDAMERRSLKARTRVPLIMSLMIFGVFLPQMYGLSLVLTDFQIVVDNFLTTFPTVGGILKIFFVWQNSQVLRPVVAAVRDDWLRPKQPWELEIMRRQAARARLVTVFDCAMAAGTYLGFAVSTLLSLNIRTVTNLTDYGDRHLMLQSYYPYDYSASPAFELTQTSQLIGTFFVAALVGMPHDFFVLLILHMSAQFEILGENIERLLRNPRDDPSNVQAKLAALVQRHVHLCRLVKTIEKAFQAVLAVQIMSMMLVVCLCGIVILSLLEGEGGGSQLFQVVPVIAALFALLTVTFVDCCASEILSMNSEEIFEKAYNIEWYAMSDKKIRDLIMLMIVSKNPRQIKAGGLIDLSMMTYCSMIKSTGGYFSMLVAVSGR